MQTIVNNKITMPNNQISQHCFNCGDLIVRDPFTDEKGRTFCKKDCRTIYHKRILITQKVNRIDILLGKYKDYLYCRINDQRISDNTRKEYKQDFNRIKDLLLDFQSISVFEYSAENLLLKDNHVKKIEERNQLLEIDVEHLRKQRQLMQEELDKTHIELNEDSDLISNSEELDKFNFDIEAQHKEDYFKEEYFVNEIKELLLAKTFSIEQLDEIANSVEDLRKKQSQGMSFSELQKQMNETRKANIQQGRER